MSFHDKYGPWALVAGASDGVGAAFARAIAERGVNVALLARRQAVLEEVAGVTKAFDMVFAEALWAELHDRGVDVLGLILGKTDTPALRRLELSRGQVSSADEPLPDAATVDDVIFATP